MQGRVRVMRRNSWGLNGTREHFCESYGTLGARIIAAGKWRKTNPRKIQGNNEQVLASEDMQEQETLDSSGQQKRYHSPRGSTGWAFLVTVMTHNRNSDACGPWKSLTQCYLLTCWTTSVMLYLSWGLSPWPACVFCPSWDQNFFRKYPENGFWDAL